MSPDDPFATLAGGLPPLDVDPARAEWMRARAHAELARAAGRARPGWRATLRRAWRRAELPLVAGVAALYVTWAVQAVMVVTER
jgi:hypothetical protein